MLGIDPRTAYALGSGAMGVLPERLVSAMAGAGASAWGWRDTPSRVMVERHLRRVHGPGLAGRALRRAVRRSFASYAYYWVEVLRLPHIRPADLDSRMSWEGVGHLEEAMDHGRGAILALPHLGSWDYGGAWMTVAGYPLTVVVEPLEPPAAFEWFASFRRSLGMEVVPLGPEAWTSVLRALKANRVVCLLSDRDLGSGGIEVEFFGERTKLPAGPVMLAMRSGARVLPTAVYHDRARGGHLGVIRPPIPLARVGRFREDVSSSTQALAGELEALIRRAPEQWHLFQPNWPSDHKYLR